MAEYIVTLPIRPKASLDSLNARIHWAQRARRNADVRAMVGAYLLLADVPRNGLVGVAEAEVTFEIACRRGPLPDSDNLAGCAKHWRDQIAKWLGVDDGPGGPVRWQYRAVRGPDETRIRIAWKEAA